VSAALATDVLESCSSAGVCEFCVCAGARNVALVVALERSTGCRVWHFFEERSAAFFALGRMMKTGKPVAVVTTSGTAVAELLPATVEAFYQSLPLVLLTADRPPSFRGTGAPQAIEQVGIFSGYAHCLDVTEEQAADEQLQAYRRNGSNDQLFTMREAAGHLGIEQPEIYDLVQKGLLPPVNVMGRFRISRRYLDEIVRPHLLGSMPELGGVDVGEGLRGALRDGRPIHINVCLGEPAAEEIAAIGGVGFNDVEPFGGEYVWSERLAEFLEDLRGLVVLLGNLRERERHGLVDFLHRLGAPVVAEAGSGLREKLPGLICRNAPEGVKKVLRIGGVPSSRFWRDLEAADDVEVISVVASGLGGLARDCETVSGADWARLLECGSVGKGLDQVEEEPDYLPEGEARWFRFLSEMIPQGALVYLGNSLPVREWNQAATFEDRGLCCYSSRGANGIDGALSTFLGLSADGAESWAIVGDLTAMYDLSAPWILRELGEGKRRIVVINNGGGKIFEKLPSLAGLADRERRAIVNDHGVSLEHWAAMWGMGYLRVEKEQDFAVREEAALVIEIFVDGAAAE